MISIISPQQNIQQVNFKSVSKEAQSYVSQMNLSKMLGLWPDGKNGIKLAQRGFSYTIKEGSIELPLYKGSIDKKAGLSTIAGWEQGAGWVEGDITTPLNTRGMINCAMLNLVDEAKNKHLVFHVYFRSTPNGIERFIKEHFPIFSKVNIAPGTSPETEQTVNSILQAVSQINKNTEVTFYHSPVNSPEVIAHNGELSYLNKTQGNETIFVENQQWYISPFLHS